MKLKIILATVAVGLFGLGFFAGMEYKSYQIRSAIQNAFGGTSDVATEQTSAMEQAKEDKMVIIPKKTGDEIQLATIKVKITKSEEKSTLPVSYGTPKVAKEGTKFVVVTMEVTNTTNSAFSLSPDFLLVDNQKREFSTYSDSIGIDNYMNYRDLSPSVKETGIYIYEIPTDATSYSMVFAKAGSKEVYTVTVK